jgi:hypothetical protein
MNKLIKFGFLLILLSVFAMSGCSMWNQIWLNWTIDYVEQNGSFARVHYTVENVGEFDLTGINLTFGIDINGDGIIDHTGRGSTFELKENESDSRTDTVYIYSDLVTASTRAEVTSFDIDNP